ncbi:hypothetical protein D3C77_627490 [compost metagenome]
MISKVANYPVRLISPLNILVNDAYDISFGNQFLDERLMIGSANEDAAVNALLIERFLYLAEHFGVLRISYNVS